MMTENKKTSMLRVFMEHWRSDEKFDELLLFLKRYHDVIDSVALFDSDCHTPVKLEISEKYNDLLCKRIRAIKSEGFSCGINILATLGHHAQYLDISFQEDYTRMTNRFGEACKGSFCMNDAGYLENYVKPKYILMLSANPDFIWIDDDVRYMHFPIGYGCFCDNCIKKFNADYHYGFTREALIQRLDDDNEIEFRKKWLSYQSDKVENLLSFIADVVYSRTDKVKLGMMSGERYFEGFRFEKWAKALSDNGKRKIMWRPGGGAYNDLDFREFTQKSIEIGRQTALLPEYVDEILSEIESFPYQQIKKSPSSTVTEAIMYLASGCNGTAWNVLPGHSDSGESIMFAENIFKKLQTKREFFKKLSVAFSDNHPLGIYDGWHKNGQAVTTKSFFEVYGGMYADTMT